MWNICETKGYGKMRKLFVEKILWENVWNIIGSLEDYICGIYVGQIFLKEYVENLWKNVWNIMKQVSLEDYAKYL